MELINGKKLAKEIRENLANTVKEEGLKPNLAVILCGDNEASKVYVKIKTKACKEVGIDFREYNLSKNISQEELLELIENLNNDKKVNGILLQYPLPKELNYDEAAEKISPDKDVDGFNPYNVGRLTIGKPKFIPCTPLGIMKMFEKYKISLEGKKAVIVGRSNIVGKPMTTAQKRTAMAEAHLPALSGRASTRRFKNAPKAREKPMRFRRMGKLMLPPTQMWNSSSRKHTAAGTIQREISADLCFQASHKLVIFSLFMEKSSSFSKIWI